MAKLDVTGAGVSSSNAIGVAKHRSDIDGLRAVAVLSVLGFHTGTPGFSGGFVGVDVFFVLSGFLICSILLREMERGRFSAARFYERRCKRILPALIAVLLFCLTAGLILLAPGEAPRLGNGVIATALSVSNVLFYLKGNYFEHGGQFNPLLMTWSLAVEEQFYLVFPWLLLLLFRRVRSRMGLVLLLLCAGSLMLSVWAEFHRPEFNFYLPFTRAWELGAGTLLAVAEIESPGRLRLSQATRHGMSVLGLALILASVLLYSPSTRFPGYEALPPVLGTVLILLAESGFANRLMSIRPLALVGLISYSLYLWHWPLLSLANIVSSRPLTPMNKLCLMLAALFAASLSYRFVEGPFRRAKSQHSGRVVAAYCGALLVVLLMGLAYRVTNGFAARVPELARIEKVSEISRPAECITSVYHGPLLGERCDPAPTGSRMVALLGDSHAEAIEATLRQDLSRGDKLVAITAFSCPPLKGVGRAVSEDPQFARVCARFNSQALKLVTERSDIDTVVLAGNWPMMAVDHFVAVDAPVAGDDEANLLAGIRAEIAALEAAGKHVVLVDDIPWLPFVPVMSVELRYLPGRAIFARMLGDQIPVAQDDGWLPRNQTITPAAEAVRAALIALPAQDPGLRVIDGKARMCPGGHCAYAEGSNLLYVDDNHLSHFGAERILKGLQLGRSAADR